MSNIPIVQGVAVDQQGHSGYSQPGYHAAPTQPAFGQSTTAQYGLSGGPDDLTGDTYIYSHEELREKRQNPTNQYRDVMWAVFFWIHIIVVVSVCVLMFTSGNAVAVEGVAFGDILFVTGVCGLLAVGLSSAALSFMFNNAETLVKTALLFSVGSSFVVAILGLLSGNMIMLGLGLLSFAVGCCYAWAVWSRIPFAAVNLKVALSGVKANLGVTAVAYFFMALGFGWSLLWFLGLGSALGSDSLALVFVLFLSYYWTHQVLSNTMHVTTAGVIGTWWFVPEEANQWWAPALTDSLTRATTYSFGSICFGSFLVAFVQALRALERHSRESDDMAIVRCLIQCILACIESIIEFLNRWAYVYVGIYGFGYIEAGRNVITLFENKGWTVIVSDDLADNVLSLMSLGIGLATGLVGLLLGAADPTLFQNVGFDSNTGTTFLVGFLVGFLFSSIFMGVVSSAINTVIVLYAEAPAEFEQSHPQLSAEMRGAWMQAWPNLPM